jgi:hypothetical protein
MPLGRAVVVMNSVLTAIVSVCVAVCCGVEESVTVAVNVKVPALVGVPLKSPRLLNPKPGGSVPLVTVALNGCRPPVSGKGWLYGLPAPALGIVLDLKASVPSETLIVKLPLVAVLAGLLLSVTCTVNVNEPVVVGVPDRIPFVPKVIPDGRAPEAKAHVNVPNPPCCSSSCT